MTEKLKPCPFCGSSSVFISEDDRGDSRWVFCNDCGTDGPCVDYRTKYTNAEALAFVVDRWNRRVEVAE